MKTSEKYADTLDRLYNKIDDLRAEVTTLKEALKKRDVIIQERENYIRELKIEGVDHGEKT